MHHPPPFKMFFTVQNIVSTTPGNHCSTFSLYVLWCPSLKWWWIGLIDSKIKSEKLPVKMFLCKDKLVLALWDRLANELLVVSRILKQLQEAMENFVFPDKCSFMLIATTKSFNKSTVDQQTLQSLWGCLGDNHWAQSVLRSLSIDRQIKTYQFFPYLRQPSRPQSVFYERCGTRYFKHCQLDDNTFWVTLTLCKQCWRKMENTRKLIEVLLIRRYSRTIMFCHFASAHTNSTESSGRK